MLADTRASRGKLKIWAKQDPHGGRKTWRRDLGPDALSKHETLHVEAVGELKYYRRLLRNIYGPGPTRTILKR